MDIEIFVTPNCGRCVYFKSLLDAAGLSYRDIDVSAGFGPLKRLRKLTGAALVPVAARGDQWWPAQSREEAQAAVQALLGGATHE